VWRLAKLGYCAKGLLYMIVGITAALAVMHVGGRVRGTRGALNLLVDSPFGRLAVALVAAGLCGFILRRLVQILVPPATGTPPKPVMRALRRAGYSVSGLGHVGIALAALRLTLGATALGGEGHAPGRDWASLMLTEKPLGGWLVLLAGLAVVGVAAFYFYMATSRRFTVDLEVERMTPRAKRVTFACGVTGHAGRGVAFFIIGALLVYAGWFVNEVSASGLGDLLRALEVRPFGTWILIGVAVGLIACGLYLLLAAWYLRLISTW
jgi:hypothetical protein